MNSETVCLGCMEADVAAGNCSRCGFDEGEAARTRYPAALKLRVVLHGQYLIGRILGQGGFGITYLGWDVNLALKLAIKEYLPMGLATRDVDRLTVSARTGEGGDLFHSGLDKFLDEGRALARFQDNAGIVSVVNFFKANNTGYLVMDFVDGTNAKQYLADRGGKIPFTEAMRLFLPVMDALAVVHRADMLHRDISPDNILVTPSGQVKILDFGAARFAVGEESRSISVILKRGYAPEEQYRTRGKQGPWTDVYALCATIYRALTGVVPPESLDRLERDDLKPPSALGVAIPRVAEAALLAGLAVRASDRIASMADLRRRLVENAAGEATRVEPPPAAAEPAPAPAEEREIPKSQPPISPPAYRSSSTTLPVIAGALLVALVGGAAIYFALRPNDQLAVVLAPVAAPPARARAVEAPVAPVIAEASVQPISEAPPAVEPLPKPEAAVPIAEAPLVASAPVAADAPVVRRVTIQSIPPGARVLLEGRSLGQTPLRAAEVPPGEKRLRFELSGYESVDRSLDGSESEVRVALRRVSNAVKAPAAAAPEKEKRASTLAQDEESDSERPGFWRRLGRGFKGAGKSIGEAGKHIKDGFHRDRPEAGEGE